MPIYDYLCECGEQWESIEPFDTLKVLCICGKLGDRVITTPPTWKFADTHKGMWCGDSSKALKKFKKNK